MTQNGAQQPPGKPPKGLRLAQRRLWKAVIAAYEVEAHHLAILEAACRELDRSQEAEDMIRTDGPYMRDRYGGTKAHPAVAVSRSSRLAAARLLRELGLDLDDETVRLPRSTAYRAYDRR
jgi:P27 family predicted phage terminase small subunit